MPVQPRAADWPQLLQHPCGGEHFVQVYRDQAFLSSAVGEYIGTGLAQGDGAIIIAGPEHRAAFLETIQPGDALQRGQLVLLDAEETLGRFHPASGTPDWQAFHALVGGLIAKMRLDYPAVRAYGEMVDVLWQRGEREAAIRLEEFWNELAKLQTFSLLCAYRMDHLDPQSYGALECVCKVHTHLIPAADTARFERAVLEASEEVLDAPLAGMLLSLAERHGTRTAMPQGQATLLWLQRNMPRTAERVLDEVRARLN